MSLRQRPTFIANKVAVDIVAPQKAFGNERLLKFGARTAGNGANAHFFNLPPVAEAGGKIKRSVKIGVRLSSSS